MCHYKKHVLLLAASFAVIGVLVLASDEPDLPTEAQSRLPKVFDFQHFKETFSRRYQSFSEQLARQKIFLAHAVEAFVSLINFKHKRSSSYQAVNQFSDWTADEKRRLAIKSKMAVHFQDLAEADAQEKAPVSSESNHEAATPVVSERELREELEIIDKRAISEPGFRAIKNELDAAGRLLGTPAGADETGELVQSNNPNYLAPELPSCSSIDGETSGGQTRLMTEEEARLINDTPSSGYLSSMLRSLENVLAPSRIELKESTVQEGGKLPDVVRIDHRKSHCFFEPRDQGYCGSCYAFSTISLYEWHHCNQTGKKAAFSEQYIVDCGRRVIGKDLLIGCDGGEPTSVSDFVKLSGLEMRRDYPYRDKEDECPYDEDTASERMGYLRVQDRGFTEVNIRFAEEALKKEPMIITIAFYDSLYGYGGGVSMGEGCGPEKEFHAVLLVGSGRQDGLDYWLIRNSWSSTWGEHGYFKLYKYSGCITPNYAYSLNVKFPDELDSNPNYDPTAVKQRLEEYKQNAKAEREDSKKQLKHRRRNRRITRQEMIDNF